MKLGECIKKKTINWLCSLHTFNRRWQVL